MKLTTGMHIEVRHDFALRRPMSIVNWIMRKVTGSDFDHTEIIYKPNKAQAFFLGSVGFKGVRLISPENFGKKHLDPFIRIYSNHYHGGGANKIAKERVGYTKYDYAFVLFYAPIKILTGKYVGPKSHKAARRLFCLELSGMALGLGHKSAGLLFKEIHEIVNEREDLIFEGRISELLLILE